MQSKLLKFSLKLRPGALAISLLIKKSKKFLGLEKRISFCNQGTITKYLISINVRIADRTLFLHLFIDLPLTFGLLEKSYKFANKKRYRNPSQYHEIISPSIKDSERYKRDNNRHLAYQITGAKQKRPSKMLQSLRVDQFKETLVGSTRIFVNTRDTCFSFCNEDELMVKRIQEEYECSQEEPFSRMLFQLLKWSTSSSIVVWTVCADILITALGSLHLLGEWKLVWVETGLVTKNTLRYININQIHDHFGVEFCLVYSRV